MRTRVVIVSTHQIFAEALGTVVSVEDDLEFVASGTTIAQAIDLVVEYCPDVVVIDLDLPANGGDLDDAVEATYRIIADRPETFVIVLAAHMELDTMVRAATAGACGFLPKTSHASDICRAIRTAKEGGMFVETEFLPMLVERLHATARRPMGGGSTRPSLTTREEEVLGLLGEGLVVGEIAKRLDITVNTSRKHVKNILSKLGSHSQLEAVVQAVHHGLLPRLSR